MAVEVHIARALDAGQSGFWFARQRGCDAAIHLPQSNFR
jgi:hypothetical protein